MDIKKLINILDQEHVIDFLKAIHEGYDKAGIKSEEEKRLRNRFSDLKQKNYDRVIYLLMKNNLVIGYGSNVDRTYKINYKELEINLF